MTNRRTTRSPAHPSAGGDARIPARAVATWTIACAGLLASLFAVVPGAWAQAAAAAPASTYHPGIDALNYDVRLELADTGAFIRGDVTVAIRRDSSVRRVRLDLADGMTVRGVELNGRAMPIAHAGGRIDVPLDGAPGDSLSVRVVYDGVPADGLIVRRDSLRRWTWFGDNWPDRGRHWLPLIDHPSDKATVTWTVRAPSMRTVVANGELVETRRLAGRDAGISETRWRESRPIATYMMVIAAGPLVRVDLREPDCHYGDRGQCVRQSMYVMPEHRRWLPGPFLAAGPIMTLFEGLVGPFPYEKLAHVQSRTRYGAMENASAIFYANDAFAKRTLRDDTIAHEISHQWFGDAVTPREWAHLWLSEGFANYFTALWAQYIRGDAAFQREMARARTTILSDSTVARRPVVDTARTERMAMLDANSYQKGSYLLYLLHRQLGDSAFFAGIRSYYVAHRHGTVVSDDLRRAFERSSGQPLGQFFEQWLTRPGVAEPLVGWAHDARDSTVMLVVLQEGAAGAYELPLPVLLTETDGTERRLTASVPAERRSTVLLPGRYSSMPKSLRFDPDALLLARITRP